MIKRWPLHAILLGLFPIIFLYQHNLNEMFAVEIIDPVIWTILAAVLLTGLFSLLHRSVAKGGLLTTVLLVFFYSFGQVVEFLPKQPQRNLNDTSLSPEMYLLIGLVTIIVVVWFFVWRTKSRLPVLTTLLNLIGLVLVVSSVGQISYAHMTRPEGEVKEQVAPALAGKIKVRHDIYHIVLDGYARADVIKRVFDYDNSSMNAALEDMGFLVASKAHSNYAQTQLSVASMLNMNYIDSLFRANRAVGYRNQLSQIVAENAVFNLVGRLGYSTATFESGYAYTRIKNTDFYFEPTVTTSEFQNLLIELTPIPLFISKERNSFSRHRDRIDYMLDKLPELFEIPSPKYVYAHLICPHPPFVFGENGKPVQRDWFKFAFADGSDYFEFGGSVDGYKEGYINQLEYVNQRLSDVLSEIISESENDPIIIIHGDHGSGVGLDWNAKDQSDMSERFGILLAVRLPDFPRERFPQDLTLVNVYRLIFQNYFNIVYTPLQNRSYFSTMKQPFDYNDVTDEILSK